MSSRIGNITADFGEGEPRRGRIRAPSRGATTPSRADYPVISLDCGGAGKGDIPHSPSHCRKGAASYPYWSRRFNLSGDRIWGQCLTD